MYTVHVGAIDAVYVGGVSARDDTVYDIQTSHLSLLDITPDTAAFVCAFILSVH